MHDTGIENRLESLLQRDDLAPEVRQELEALVSSLAGVDPSVSTPTLAGRDGAGTRRGGPVGGSEGSARPTLWRWEGSGGEGGARTLGGGKRFSAPMGGDVDRGGGAWASPSVGEGTGNRGAEAGVDLDFRTTPDRYEDRGLLGVGAMGEVRRVRDPNLNRTMAIKLLRAGVAHQWPDIARFVTEARVTAQLQHPGIVSVHELGRLEDGRYYFTMDEVHGRTLEEVIDEVHRASSDGQWRPAPSGWTFRRLIDAFHRVCATVAFAHARGVVHRDLKPSNIMLGEFEEVLVVDWGLAKVLADRVQSEEGSSGERRHPRILEGVLHATMPGVVAGTLAYMAPEQARGEQEAISTATDVFALGAILYQILAGTPHIVGGDFHAAMRQLLCGPVRPPGRAVWEERPGEGVDEAEDVPRQLPVPGQLQQICLKAMSMEPQDRYPDAGVLADEVGAWLEGARRRERALAVVGEATVLQEEVADLRRRAATLKDEAAAILEAVPPYAPVSQKKQGWILEDEAAELERTAEVKEAEMLQLLDGALTLEPHLREARDLLAAHYRRLHADAELRRNASLAARYESVLRAFDTGRHRAYLEGRGAVTIVTDPPGARVTCYRYEQKERRLVPVQVGRLGTTPLRRVPLKAGSYLFVIELEGRSPVSYPVRIGREEVWEGIRPGEQTPYPIYLPRPEELGPDDIYVPAGVFQSGGDWLSEQTSLPYRRIWLDGFVMGRYPVTNRRYLEFLNDLVENGRESEALAHVPRERTIGEQEGQMVYGRDADGRFVLRPDADNDLWDLDWPVFLVDWYSARAYASWYGRKTGKPWRIPWELEWEKAARGVDGRYYPWGDFLDPTWCCVRESHQDQHLPARVDDYPIDTSPYGVRGMAGGAVDWCLDRFTRQGPAVTPGEPCLPMLEMEPETDLRTDTMRAIKGGAWSFFQRSARATRHAGVSGSLRDHGVGFRLARTFPLPEPPSDR